MSIWTEGQLLGFDLETTSADPFTALPVSYALVLRRDATRMSRMSGLINPGAEIPAESTEIHGITNEMVEADGLPLADALELIKEKLLWASNNDIPLVGTNLSYDLTIMHLLADLDLWVGCVVDVFVMDKHYDQYRKGKRTLTALIEHYGINQEGVAHTADADAVSSILVALAMAERYPLLGKMDMVDLHNEQEVWADEQRASLSEYFVKKGDPPIPKSNFGWPIQNGAKAGFVEDDDDEQLTF